MARTHEVASSYRSILVPVCARTGAKHTVHLAACLAHQFGARLIGTASFNILPEMPIEYPIMIDYEFLGIIRERAQKRILEAEAIFRCESGMITDLEWRHGTLDAAEFAALHSRSADLVIVRRTDSEGPIVETDVDVADLVLEAGRPVIVVPPSVEYLSAKHIVVAWKDTREARRAVMDSLPFLRAADSALIAAIGDEAEGADDVCSYLKRHDVHCEAHKRPLSCDSVAQELGLLARVHGADLIVCGAYGHGRAREWAFGGVTRELLREAHVCCLMSH